MCCFKPVGCLTKILITVMVIVLLFLGIILSLTLLTPRVLGIENKVIFNNLTSEDLGIADISIWDSIMLYSTMKSSTFEFEQPTEADRDRLRAKLENASVSYENLHELYDNELITKTGEISFNGNEMAVLLDSIAVKGIFLKGFQDSDISVNVVNTGFFKTYGMDEARLVIVLDISKYSEELRKITFLDRFVSDKIWIKLVYELNSDGKPVSSALSTISVGGLNAQQSAIFLNALYVVAELKTEEAPQDAIAFAGKEVMDRILNNIGSIQVINNDQISFRTRLFS